MSDAYAALAGSTGDVAGDATGGSSGPSALGLGTLALGAGGLGFMLAKGPSPLPGQFQQIEQTVPGLQSQGATLYGEGQALTAQGTQALDMAQRGELTPEQQAQLKVYSTGLENKARQEYASMGRSPDQDTSFIQTTANIDTQVNAMANAQIQSTIQLGLGQLSAGSNFSGQALGFESAANAALLEAGKAQLELDKQYSDALTNTFKAIGTMVGAVGKAALV